MKTRKSSGTVLFFRSPQRREWPTKEKLEGIYRFARARRWRVVTIEAPRTAAAARAAVSGWRPLGCLVDMDASRRVFTLEALGGTPTVFLDFDDRLLGGRTFRVNHDPVAVGTLAAKRLSVLGCTGYAFVGYTREWAWSRARLDAFRAALGPAGDGVRHFEFPAARQPTARIRAAFGRFVAALPRPCGMMLANDALAEELYPACARAGVSIPGDLAVIGVDDDERLCNNLRPSLSSIRLDFDQAGWLLAELLDQRIANPSLNPVVRFYRPIGVAPRETTARSDEATVTDSLVARIDRQIDAHALDGSTVAQILAPLDCSRRTAETRYRVARGKSILAAVRDLRLARAQELLRTTSISVTEVAAACGYARPAHFAALFRARTGLTMSAWRERPSKREN